VSTTHTSTYEVVAPEDDPDDGRAIMALFTKELRRRLSTKETREAMTAAEMTVILRLLSDNSISLATIRQGDFGGTVSRVAEQFPFDDTGRMVQ
jgi:hypothetical protein